MQFDEAELYSGLAILHWANYTDPDWDHDYYRRAIERNGGVALDIGCGSGRLLRSYLRAGLNVEGMDISADMLDACRSLAAEAGLSPTLHHQAMQQLDLPGRYNTIYIPCGTFVCVMDREEALEALRRFHCHLAPGGELVFNIFNPDHDYSGAAKRELPQPWQPWVRYPQRDGRVLVVERRLTAIDPIEQYETEERRLRLFDGEELVREEVRAGQCHWYFKHEVLLMLRLAGFGEVRVTGDYTDEPFGPQHSGTMVFHARRSEHA